MIEVHQDPVPESKTVTGRRGGKVTEEEWEDRVTFTAKLLAKKLYKSDIKRVLYRKYEIGYRQAENIITAAKKLILEETGKTKAEHKVESLAFYENVIRDPQTGTGEKLAAQAAIDRLLGLASPDDEDGDGKGGTIIQIVHEVVTDRSSVRHEDAIDVTPPKALENRA